MQVPKPYTLETGSSEFPQTLSTLPECNGIYAIFVPGNAPHLGSSVNLKRRLTRLLVPSYTASPGPLSKYLEKISEVSYWPAGSRLEISLILYELNLHFHPSDYLRRLRLRMPWFVGVTTNDQFPRLEVSNRLGRNSGAKYGPFLTRDLAQEYEVNVLSLHQLRRCTEVLSPHVDHPGCIYGEMNQCMRPCQAAVTVQEYAAESGRVEQFLATSGKSALGPLAGARDRAAESLDFEQAALVHRQMDRITAAVASRDKVIGSVDAFNGIALTKGLGTGCFKLWPLYRGYWQDPVTLAVSLEAAETQSLDHRLRESLTAALAAPSEIGKRLEHLALFSRWYYSSWRDGQWFPFRALADLNYRQLVREISRLAKPTTIPTAK